MAIDSALGRLGAKAGVCTSSTRPTNPFEGQIVYESDTNRTLIYDNSAWLVIADNQVLSIDSANERVGIGTTTPSTLLHVGDTAVSDNIVTVTAANNTSAGVDLMGDLSGAKGFRVKYEGDGNYFAVEDNTSGVQTERMRIDSSGNVGIGTTTPSTKLEVADSNPATLTLKGTNSIVTAGAEVQAIDFYQSDSSGGAGVSARIVGVGNNSSGAQNLTFHTGQAGAASVAERVRIDSNGSVGIGTTSPTGRVHIYSNTSGNGIDANYLKMDRANTSTESAINWATAGANKWFLGHDNTGNDDFYLYSWGGSTYAMRVATAGYVTMEKQPAFTARITTTGVRYDQQVLPFSSASLNVGNHYNTSTYLFTAPVSGYYFFSYSVLVRNNSGTARTETGFWKNGGWLMNRGNSYVNSTGSSSDHNQASSSVVTYMGANDTMGIYQLQTSPSDTYGGTALSVFTGRLVS